MTEAEIVQQAQQKLLYDAEFSARVKLAAGLVEKDWRNQTLQVPSGSQMALVHRGTAIALVLADLNIDGGAHVSTLQLLAAVMVTIVVTAAFTVLLDRVRKLEREFERLNARRPPRPLHVGTEAPTEDLELGDFWFNPTSERMACWDGGRWWGL